MPKPWDEDVDARVRGLEAQNQRLTKQLSTLMDVFAKLEITDLEHSLYFSNQKRLMDFVQRITMRLDDDDLMDVIVEELLIELKADRVSYILVGDGPKPTWAVSQEAVDKGIKRLPLPYFVDNSPPGTFVKFLQKAVKHPGGPTTCEWPEPISIVPDAQYSSLEEEFRAALEDEFDLASKVECRAAMAFPIETTLQGKSLFCVQRINSDQGWTRQQRDLFQNMCRYASSLLDQTQLSEHIRELKDQLGSLIESMPSAIIGMDLLGTVTTWNGKSQEFFGIAEEEALGNVFWELVPEYHFMANALKNVLQVEASTGMDFEPMPYKRKDGNVVYYRANLFTMFRRNRGEVALRIDDVTRTVELNHQLFHSQRMETVGTLAGGLAHEFNNVLGGMVGTSSLMRQRLQKGHSTPQELLDDLQVIEGCADRASAMVKRLLALSRRAEIVMEPLDLNAIVRSLVSLCGHSFESRIQVKAKLPPAETWISADRSQLEQAILNICVNARDAMKAGGTLSLVVERFAVDEAFRQKHAGCTAPELVRLTLQDTGEGIPLDQLDQIFEPFYTTKRENGSGLGLTIVDSIMKQHKGFVEVDSDRKIGTRFQLYFQPAVKAEGREPAAPAPAPGGKGEPRQGEILFVDDDEVIRRMAARIMGELGYTAATAADGASAIRIVESGLHFDLVVLDVDMPVMNGLDTANVLWRLRPDLKILFCTGRQHQYDMAPVLAKGEAGVLVKPFDMAAMADKVREALAGKGAKAAPIAPDPDRGPLGKAA
ncbi:MAG: response regulator [Fibrobacteres bacterium]|nr:response regulator [Fibrobacterota bacterium]